MDYQKLTQGEIKQALDFSAAQIKKYLPQFTDKFQNAYSVNHFYEPIDNVDWTNGFWTGEIWLAYEHTKDEAFRKAAEIQVKDYLRRIDNKIMVDHHDMGFFIHPVLRCSLETHRKPYRKRSSDQGCRPAHQPFP